MPVVRVYYHSIEPRKLVVEQELLGNHPPILASHA